MGGIAQLTVTATDSQGQSISTSFFVTVNGTPQVLLPLQNLILNQQELPFAIDLTEFFTDAEDGGAGLTYTVIGNTNSNIIETTVAGVTLTLNPGTDIAEGGMTTITVRATDTSGQFIDQTFDVTVTNQAPTVIKLISDDNRSAPPGGTTTINLDLYFSDFGDLDYTVIGNTNITVVTNPIGSAVPATDVLTVTVPAGATSGQQATLTVQARDAGGLTAQQSFVVTVQ
jgi:large repetitive protein